MTDYPGNALTDIERALAAGKNGVTLTRLQMQQVLSLVAELVEAKNELVRENQRLLAQRSEGV